MLIYFVAFAGIGTSASTIRAQVKSEIEAEKEAARKAAALADTYSAPREVNLEHAPVLAVSGVYFKCPMAGPEVLPKKEMDAYIEEFLLGQLAEEPELTTALMIHTLNKDPEKVKTGIETLCKYIDNVLNHPGEEKFRKIREKNKAFQERVASLKGTEEFLQATGFQHKLLPWPEGFEENFLVLSEEAASDTHRLKTLKEALFIAEPIRPELDRNIMVFHPSPTASKIQVPNDFYSISPEELKKEQQIKAEAVEKLGMLRTKEMRERERLRELRRYRYCLIRVRLPDGVILQSTFRANEKLQALHQFVRECLVNDWIPFSLSAGAGGKLTEENLTLAEYDLAPASVVTLEFDANVMKEIAAQPGAVSTSQHLKPELMANIQSL